MNFEKIIEPYITGSAKTCSYCDRLDELILLEGQHSYITIAIGQYMEGYLQVCAKKHRTAATGLTSTETQELVKMKKLVREVYKEIYGISGVAFEHGKAGSCLWSYDTYKNMVSLCHHCHIHFVPANIDIRDQIKTILSEEIVVKNIYELKAFREKIGAEPYLYFEDSQEIGYVYPVDDEKIPRQFLRTCVAEKLGCKERGDWIKYPGVEFFQATIDKLKQPLQRAYNFSYSA